MEAIQTLNLSDTYVHLSDASELTAFEGGDVFWQTLEAPVDLDQGRMVCVTPQRADWLVWERHPHGDELIMLIDGKIDLVLEMPDGIKTVPLEPKRTILIPKGVWHRAVVHEPGDALFITRGAGTDHKPYEPIVG